jgi:hypothetical protein
MDAGIEAAVLLTDPLARQGIMPCSDVCTGELANAQLAETPQGLAAIVAEDASPG